MYPLQPKPTALVVKAAIVLIWVLAVAIMCPAAMVLTVDQVPFYYMVYNEDFINTIPLNACYENFANPQMRKVYTVVLFAYIYLVPLTVITFMYGSIGVKLYSSVVANREPQQANDTVQARRPVISQKKITAIKMLILVTLLFMLSWLPLWTLLMMADYAGLDGEQLELLTSYFFPFAHWLAFSNSSINPIIYGYYNENFKKGFKAVCKTKPFSCLMQCNLWKLRTRRDRKDRSVQAPCRREATNNPNHQVLGMRNRVHNGNKSTDATGGNRTARLGCMVVHSERSRHDPGVEIAIVQKDHHGEEAERASCLAASVRKAWEN